MIQRNWFEFSGVEPKKILHCLMSLYGFFLESLVVVEKIIWKIAVTEANSLKIWTKQEQTHRSRNQTYDYQRGNVGGSDKLGVWD